MITSKRHILFISGTIVSAILLVTVLAMTALKPINQKGGFSRKYGTNEPRLLRAIERPSDVIDFAGSTENNLFFTTKTPGKLFFIDKYFQNKGDLNFPVPDNKKINSNFLVAIDSPGIQVIAGNLPGIIRTEVKKETTPEVYKLPALFTRSAQISPNTFALRMFEGLNQIFARVNFTTGEIKKAAYLSNERKDAGISTDGILEYDKKNNQLIYVHFYNNSISYMDTNLNILSRSKTIDTLEHIQFEAGTSSKQSITNLTPKRFTNGYCSVSDGKLFINSRVLSDNEVTDKFREGWVIDTYDTKNNQYKESFYIPNFKDKKPQLFKVISNLIVVLYNNAIVCYSLPDNLAHN